MTDTYYLKRMGGADLFSKHNIVVLKNSQSIILGRAVDADVVIDSSLISRYHAIIKRSDHNSCTITDNRSMNGVYVNGVKLTPQLSHSLSVSDTFSLGPPVDPDGQDSSFTWSLCRRVNLIKRKHSDNIENCVPKKSRDEVIEPSSEAVCPEENDSGLEQSRTVLDVTSDGNGVDLASSGQVTEIEQTENNTINESEKEVAINGCSAFRNDVTVAENISLAVDDVSRFTATTASSVVVVDSTCKVTEDIAEMSSSGCVAADQRCAQVTTNHTSENSRAADRIINSHIIADNNISTCGIAIAGSVVEGSTLSPLSYERRRRREMEEMYREELRRQEERLREMEQRLADRETETCRALNQDRAEMSKSCVVNDRASETGLNQSGPDISNRPSQDSLLQSIPDLHSSHALQQETVTSDNANDCVHLVNQISLSVHAVNSPLTHEIGEVSSVNSANSQTNEFNNQTSADMTQQSSEQPSTSQTGSDRSKTDDSAGLGDVGKSEGLTAAVREEVMADIADLMEEELQCGICNELFIKPMTLGCAHSFCEVCIQRWMRIRKECPVCRARVTSTQRSLVLESYIEKMMTRLGADHQARRVKLVRERTEECETLLKNKNKKKSSDVSEVIVIDDERQTTRATRRDNQAQRALQQRQQRRAQRNGIRRYTVQQSVAPQTGEQHDQATVNVQQLPQAAVQPVQATVQPRVQARVQATVLATVQPRMQNTLERQQAALRHRVQNALQQRQAELQQRIRVREGLQQTVAEIQQNVRSSIQQRLATRQRIVPDDVRQRLAAVQQRARDLLAADDQQSRTTLQSLEQHRAVRASTSVINIESIDSDNDDNAAVVVVETPSVRRRERSTQRVTRRDNQETTAGNNSTTRTLRSGRASRRLTRMTL